MKLDALTLEQCERVRTWRNAEMECWRTPFMLTREMQRDFYERCCDRNSPHRYWAIVVTEKQEYSRNNSFFIGMGGIIYIQWENRIGEITLIIDPDRRKDGNGEKAVDLLLDQGFFSLNLENIFAECYEANSAITFWMKVAAKYNAYQAKLPSRKFYNGKYYDSIYLNFNRKQYAKIR